jgi:fatty-acyl-CoA synthase
VRFVHTVGRILDLAASAVPTRLSVTLGNQTRTFAQSQSAATRMANALYGLGLRRGDRLMYWGPISLHEIDVFFATQKLGVVFVPFKDSLSPREAIAQVTYVKPALVVGDATIADRLLDLHSSAGVPVATIGGTGPGIDLDAAVECASENSIEIDVDDEDIHAIFLTSGSTGEPKGVMVSHRASWHRSLAAATRTPACGGRGEVNMFPLFHWAGWNFLLTAWMHLRTIHLTPKADAVSLVEVMNRWSPGSLYAIPAVWERLLEYDQPFETRSLRLACTGTYRFESTLVDRIRQTFPNAYVTSSWGATELGTGATIGEDDLYTKPYSVGLPTPGTELRIVDGELLGRSNQMMSGYFNLPDVTAETLVEGWYHTGDLVEMDEEGFISIVGRRREVIRSGAETIAPAEVEEALSGLPGIDEVSVVGLPDPVWGEVVCAAVVLTSGAALPSMETIRSHVSGTLAPHKCPRRIVAVDSLPRTPATGQIQRSLVRSTIISRMSA